MKICAICQKAEVVGRRRKYCGLVCAREARILWKRTLRQTLKRLGRKYWEDYWPTRKARRAYYKRYMRDRRQKQRLERFPSAIALPLVNPSEER